MNLVVTLNDLNDLEMLAKSNIYGIIINIKNLAVSANYYADIDALKDIISKSQGKKIMVCLNKIMHEEDLPLLEKTLIELNNLNIDKVLFYDLSVIEIVKRLKLNLDLVIYQDHLNASFLSNNFYYDRGIKYSYLTSDITDEEIKEIKNNSKMKIFLTVYGYLPIFFSKRKLLTSYFDCFTKDKNDNSYYLKSDSDYYNIMEEDDGTTIYTKDKINLFGEEIFDSKKY